MPKNGLTDERVDMHRTIYSGEGHALRAFPQKEKTGSAPHTGAIRQRQDMKKTAGCRRTLDIKQATVGRKSTTSGKPYKALLLPESLFELVLPVLVLEAPQVAETDCLTD